MIGTMTAGTDSRPAPVSAPASPEATRHRSRAWRDPRLVVGVGLVALSVLLGARLLGGAHATVGVWAARSTLHAGQRLRPADLVRTEVRFDNRADADRYLSAGAPITPGTLLARDVGAGELLPRAAVSGRRAGPLTEVPLAVPAESVPTTVRVGSVVDVWVTPDPGTDGSSARTTAKAMLVFDDVAVVATPRSGTALGPSASRQVIVGVDGAQQARLPEALARVAGGTVLLTRQH